MALPSGLACTHPSRRQRHPIDRISGVQSSIREESVEFIRKDSVVFGILANQGGDLVIVVVGIRVGAEPPLLPLLRQALGHIPRSSLTLATTGGSEDDVPHRLPL